MSFPDVSIPMWNILQFPSLPERNEKGLSKQSWVLIVIVPSSKDKAERKVSHMIDIATWFQTEDQLAPVDNISININIINSKINKQLLICLQIMNENLRPFQPNSVLFLKLPYCFSAVFESIFSFQYILNLYVHRHICQLVFFA